MKEDKIPKNLIIISIDTLRSDCISANPNKELLKKFNLKAKPHTPILDWFVKNGTFFTNCVSAAPYTTTSHASILTGQYPNTHKLQHFLAHKLVSDTIFEILKKEGYETLSQIDFECLGPVLGFTNGVDKFVEGNDDESFKWIKKNKNKPMACFFHLAGAHSPYGFAKNLRAVNVFIRKINALAKIHGIDLNNSTASLKSYASKNPRKEDILWWKFNCILAEMHAREKYGEIMDLYVEGVNFFEKNRFSKLINGLKKLGIFENSVIVIVGDHGESWSKKQRAHFDRDGIRGEMLHGDVTKVPLIFFGKDVPKDLMVNYQIRTIDIVPTVLDLLGIGAGKRKFDGASLVPFEKIKKNRGAYIQAWMDNREFIMVFDRFAKKVNSCKEKDFKTYLEADAFSDGRKKIIRRFSSGGDLLGIEYMKLAKGEKETMLKNSEAGKLLLEIEKFVKNNAEKENNSNMPTKKELDLMERDIRALGY